MRRRHAYKRLHGRFHPVDAFTHAPRACTIGWEAPVRTPYELQLSHHGFSGGVASCGVSDWAGDAVNGGRVVASAPLPSRGPGSIQCEGGEVVLTYGEIRCQCRIGITTGPGGLELMVAGENTPLIEIVTG